MWCCWMDTEYKDAVCSICSTTETAKKGSNLYLHRINLFVILAFCEINHEKSSKTVQQMIKFIRLVLSELSQMVDSNCKIQNRKTYFTVQRADNRCDPSLKRAYHDVK